MILKIYGLIWALGLIAAGVLYLTGNFTSIFHVVFGFLSFGAVFMGIISVLPAIEFHGPPKEH